MWTDAVDNTLVTSTLTMSALIKKSLVLQTKVIGMFNAKLKLLLV